MQVILSRYKQVQTGREKYCVSLGVVIRCKSMDKDMAIALASKLSGGKYVDNTVNVTKVVGRIAYVPVAKVEKSKELKVTDKRSEEFKAKVEKPKKSKGEKEEVKKSYGKDK